MNRGRNGPRQPGGGRQQAGPRHQQRGTRGAARFGKGEGGKRFGGGGKERPRAHTSFRHPEAHERYPVILRCPA